MSKLKIVDDLFLEKSELNRLMSFIFNEGFESRMNNNTEKFGFVRNEYFDPENKWLKLETSNTLGIAKLNSGIAYDKDNLRITLPESILLEIPQDSKWYWLKISHQYTNIESGKVSIGGSNGGLLIGKDTKFKELLRGQPNFPSKIRFVGSEHYNLEYEVLEVLDDENVLLQGVFENLEEDLQYVVVGTFTPGIYPPQSNKDIFQYDFIKYELVEENTDGTIPTILVDKEFLACRVKNDSGNLEIQDKRHLFQYKTRIENQSNNITRAMNPLIALEFIKKMNFNNDIFYVVGFDWKFNIENQNLNTTTTTTTITTGRGGKFKSIVDFKDGDFNGWRYYYENGDFSKILKSIKNSDNTITLMLDTIKTDCGIGISICPNSDEIGILFNFEVSTNNPYARDFKYFPINKKNPTAIFPENQLYKLNQFCDVKWFYKSGQVTSQIFEFNESEYYTEKAFDNDGNLINQNEKINKQDLFFNGGIDPGNTDNWHQFYPNEFALMYGNNLRVIDANTVASKLFYKFFGSNTVKIQGKINLTLTNDPTTNAGLAPNGVLFKTPFKWFDDTVGNRFIRSFVGGLRYKSATEAVNFEMTRIELFYESSLNPNGEDDPTDKIAIRYLKNGKGMLNDANQTGNVTYDNPLPTGASLEFDIDLMVYFDSFDKNYVNGPIGTDNTNPNVVSGGLPGISNYQSTAQKNSSSNGFNCQIIRNTNETNYKVKVDFIVEYTIRQQMQSTSGWWFWQHTNVWYQYYNRQVDGSVIMEISELNKATKITVNDVVFEMKNIKITGITLL